MIAQHTRQSDRDSDLEVRVANQLWQRTALRNIDVTVQQGQVFLNGSVHSFHDRQLCICGARRVAGVYELVDRIQVT